MEIKMHILDNENLESVHGGVEVPLPSLGDALVAIALELYNAFK
jgi:hypothetical protein